MKKMLLMNKLSKLDSNQRMMYEMGKKSTGAFFCFTAFLGGIGAQWFYIGKIWAGVLSILFCWTFIPCIISFFTMFFSSICVRGYNLDLVNKILMGTVNG